MTTTHEFDEHVAHPFPGSEGSRRSHLPVVAEPQENAQGRIADSFSVDLQTANQGDRDIAVLIVRGEIDIASAPVLVEVLLPVLERQTGPVVIDLSEVPFMDSTGVHVLVDTLRRLEPENRQLAIACRERSQIHRLLALQGLLDVLTVHRSRESAVSGGDERIRSERRDNGWPPAGLALTDTAAIHRPGKRAGAQAFATAAPPNPSDSRAVAVKTVYGSIVSRRTDKGVPSPPSTPGGATS